MTKAFDRILIVMFENQYRSYVLSDPFMVKLARAGMSMTNYFGCFHPSQTNYVASLAGELCAVSNDDAPTAPLMQRNLVDLMEEGGISWKAYMEALPPDPWNPLWASPDYPASAAPIAKAPDNGTDLARYYRKHNAFASFHTIQKDADRWARIVDDAQFWQDVSGKNLPDYSWFTPDIWNDGHYLYNTHIDTNPRTQLIPQLAGWLQYVFLGDVAASKVQGGTATKVDNLGLNLDIDLLLRDPASAWAASHVPPGTLIVVTFDEADYDAVGFDTAYDGPNQIYTVLLGDMITPGTTCDLPLNHYSLIRTVERNFDLGNLAKNDATANWIRPLWNEHFAWGAPQSASLQAGGNLALATIQNVPRVIISDASGLHQAVLTGDTWAPVGKVDIPVTPERFALAACGDAALLVWANADDSLSWSLSPDGTIWSAPEPVPGAKATGNFALAGFTDTADGTANAMLVWRTQSGFMQSCVFCHGAWLDQQAVGQLTDGAMALAQFGPSLFLTYKERKTRHMRMTSYNLAPFNAFKALAFDGSAAPQNDTTLRQWNAADFHVGHFARKFAAQQNDYQAMGALALAAVDGEMRLVHRGAYTDTPSAFEEIFALTGILTSGNAYSNGYGTLDQAGWTVETELPGVQLDPDSAIAMTTQGDTYVLVWQDSKTKALSWRRGSYSAQ